MGETEMRLSAAELDRLSIRCAPCGTETVFSAKSTEEVREVVCQNCDKRIVGAKELIRNYRSFFAEVQRAENVTFVLRVRD